MTRSAAARIVVVAAAAAAAIAPLPPPLVERWYSRGWYAALQPMVTAVSSLSPVALLDVGAVALAAAGAAAFVRRWRTAGPRRAAAGAAGALVTTAALVYLWFLLFWGLNYRRLPMEERLEYDASRVSREQAVTLARQAAAEANQLAPSSRAWSAADAGALADAFRDVESLLGARTPARLAAPRRSLLSYYFRTAGIDGMTDPFFLEIIVVPDLLPFERAQTLAHEWAHLAGYADEDEANFIAWLACVRAGPPAAYSGWLSAYQHLSSAGGREERASLRASLHPQVVADLDAIRQRLRRASPRVSAAARGAYDAYLRANRVEEGIASYDAVVRLMLGTSFDAGWRPRLRAASR